MVVLEQSVGTIWMVMAVCGVNTLLKCRMEDSEIIYRHPNLCYVKGKWKNYCVGRMSVGKNIVTDPIWNALGENTRFCIVNNHPGGAAD